MNRTALMVAAFMLLLGVGGGYLFATRTATDTKSAEEMSSSERVPLFYRNPMNPAVTSPVPAQDNMGMDYIPVYADDGASDGAMGTVRIDPVTVQNIGVRTTPAVQETLSHPIRALGRVDYDEQRLASLHPKTEGWIEKLYISRTGDAVKKGTILLSTYSPQLVSSQQEYLLALKNRDTLRNSPHKDIREGAEKLAAITRQRLLLMDVPEHQIHELEKTGEIKQSLHIHSPFDGIVLTVGAREGQFVTPRTELYRLADLSRAWVYVDVYEYELPWVQIGDQATMEVKSLPGREFKGTVTYIYPYFESKTRTVKVRLEFDNQDLALKPETFANVTLHSGRSVDAIVIPEEAVIRSGTRQRVFVVRGGGKFEPREVTLGVSSNGRVQVLKGITPGDEVVISGQFLIDSESSLREAAVKMSAPGTRATSGDTTEHEMSAGPVPAPAPAPPVSPMAGGHVHD